MLLAIGRTRGRAVMVLLVLCLFIFFFSRGVRNYDERIISMELISLTYPGKISISQQEILITIRKQLAGAEVSSGSGENGSYKLVLTTRTGKKTFIFQEAGRLYNLRTGKIYLLKDGGECLESAVKKLERQNPYGAFLTWSQAKEIFRKYDKARVVDFTTGMSFMVQRRAGSHHADVQPLTAEDSAVMKLIYGGKWSWKRRAIIVEVRGRRLAASMNGMPHGAGAIANNNFAGHFCIHFRESKLHSNEENLAHQLMVWKAAGKVTEMLAGAGPERVMRVMLTAMEQGDPGLAAKLFAPSKDSSETQIAKQLAEIKWLAATKISQPKESQTKDSQTKLIGSTSAMDIIASYGLADGTRVQNRRVTFILKKDQKGGLWRIDPSTLEQLLSKRTSAKETREDQTQDNQTQDNQAGTIYSDWYVDNSL